MVSTDGFHYGEGPTPLKIFLIINYINKHNNILQCSNV